MGFMVRELFPFPELPPKSQGSRANRLTALGLCGFICQMGMKSLRCRAGVRVQWETVSTCSPPSHPRVPGGLRSPSSRNG